MDVFDDYIKLVNKVAPDAKELVLNKRDAFRNTIILWEAGFVVLIFSFLIFVTHRVAGPIYKLQKYLRGIREGTENDKLYFRKGDYFPEVAEDVNLTIESLREDIVKNKTDLEEILAYIKNLEMVLPEDKKPVLNSIISRLSDEQRNQI